MKIIVHAFPVSKEGIHIGLAVVSSKGKNVVFGFNKYTDSLSMDPAIDATNYPNSDAIVGESIAKVKDELFVTSSRTGAIKILVVILGGKSSDDVTIPSQDLKAAGINRVIVVAVTSNTDKTVYTPPATVSNDVIISVTYITIKTTAQILVERINSGECRLPIFLRLLKSCQFTSILECFGTLSVVIVALTRRHYVLLS